jgi:hypothetical protein
MPLTWRLKWIGALFDAAESPPARPARDYRRFDLGVCPGCRGVRGVASLQCTVCGSAAPVTADA